jgi:hypothetical protein
MPERELIEPKQRRQKIHSPRREGPHHQRAGRCSCTGTACRKSGNPAPWGIPRALRSLPLQTSAACAALGGRGRHHELVGPASQQRRHRGRSADRGFPSWNLFCVPLFNLESDVGSNPHSLQSKEWENEIPLRVAPRRSWSHHHHLVSLRSHVILAVDSCALEANDDNIVMGRTEPRLI